VQHNGPPDVPQPFQGFPPPNQQFGQLPVQVGPPNEQFQGQGPPVQFNPEFGGQRPPFPFNPNFNGQQPPQFAPTNGPFQPNPQQQQQFTPPGNQPPQLQHFPPQQGFNPNQPPPPQGFNPNQPPPQQQQQQQGGFPFDFDQRRQGPVQFQPQFPPNLPPNLQPARPFEEHQFSQAPPQQQQQQLPPGVDIGGVLPGPIRQPNIQGGPSQFPPPKPDRAPIEFSSDSRADTARSEAVMNINDGGHSS